MAKEYLKRLRKIDTQIKNKSVEVAQANEFGVKLDPLMEELNLLYEERRGIIKTIEVLPEAEYDVLHKVYVQYETLYEVASDRKISYSLATTIHGKALKHLAEILNDSG